MGLGGGVAGGGRGRRRSRWLLMLCGEEGSKTLFTTRNGFMVGTVATTKRFMGAAFSRSQLEPPMALDNR